MVQAYHNELVSKISHLEEENVKLKKEKVHDLIQVLFFPLFFVLIIESFVRSLLKNSIDYFTYGLFTKNFPFLIENL